MKYVLELHDICYPDYFQGSNAIETYAIPMYAGMTFKDFAESIMNEYNSYMSSPLFDHVDSEKMIKDAVKELLPYSEDALVEEIARMNFSSDYEEGSVYAYIGVFIQEDDYTFSNLKVIE